MSFEFIILYVSKALNHLYSKLLYKMDIHIKMEMTSWTYSIESLKTEAISLFSLYQDGQDFLDIS